MKLNEIMISSPKEIAEQFCKKYNIKKAAIHDGNGIINVAGDVIIDKELTEQLPVQFGRTLGDFTISKSDVLTSLKGCPTEVGQNFSAYSCVQLTSLEHGPIKVSGTYYQCSLCHNLQSFEHVPPDFTGKFWGDECSQVKNLKGLPKKLKSLNIANCTGITSLEGIPEIITKGPLIISGCINLTSLDYIPREVVEGTVVMKNVEQIKNLLALFDIEGNFELKHDNNEIETIINKHLKNSDRDEGMIECRQELKDAGFGEYARLK